MFEKKDAKKPKKEVAKKVVKKKDYQTQKLTNW